MTRNHYERILRERDEARELLASEKITRNHIIKRSVEVERERDEAREKAERYRIEANAMMMQRDEAREARDKLQVMRKEVVAANKGAKINAQVSNSLAGKLNHAENEIKRLRMICQHAHDRLLRGAPDNDLFLILEKSWKEKTK